MAAELKVYAVHTWETFVRGSVLLKPANPDSRALILKMMPYFPKSCMVIANYLNDADQFWKVNYHWELMSQRVDMASKLKLGADSAASLAAIRKSLDANRPDPLSGYVKSKTVGQPHDRSAPADIVKRWQRLRESKKAFRKVLDAEKIAEKHKPSEPWDLAAAPLAKPGTSQHGTGFAFDIHGDSVLIKSICNGLKATLVFDEKSHVHVEFKQGVIVSGAHVADDWRDGRWSGWKHVDRLA
ncbi:MAG: hypothetical protein U1F41_14915 [Burkholderiales bacterium]